MENAHPLPGRGLWVKPFSIVNDFSKMEKVFTILKVFLIFEKVFSRNIVVSDQGLVIRARKGFEGSG